MIIAAKNPQPLSTQRKARGPKESVAEPLDSLVFQLPEKAGAVHGHLASDPQHALCPSSQYPLRTYMLTGDNQVAAVDFRDIFENLKSRAYPSQNYKVTEKKLDKVVIESKFTTVLLAKGSEGKYVFETKANHSTCKTPLDSFKDAEIRSMSR